MSKALYWLAPLGPDRAVATARGLPASFDSGAGGSAQLAALTADSVLLTLVAVGVCVLLVWIVRRAANPKKLTLVNTPGRPNTLNPGHVLLVMAAWSLANVAASRALQPLFPAGSLRKDVLLGLIVQAVTLAGALAVAAWTFRFGLTRGLGLTGRHWLYDTGRGIVGFLAVFPLCLGLLHLFAWAAPPDHQRHQMLTALDVLPVYWQAVVIFTAVIVAPIAEEVLFRGVLQSMIRRYTHRPWVGILVSAGLFAPVHWPYVHYMPALFVLAIVLGYNYERSGRLWAPILLHGLFNAANIFISVLPKS